MVDLNRVDVTWLSCFIWITSTCASPWREMSLCFIYNQKASYSAACLTIRAKLCDRTVSWVLRGTPAFHTNSKLDTCYSLCGHCDPDTSLYLFHFTTCRVSSGGAFSRTFSIRSALRTKPVPLCASTGTGASSAVLRNVCSWACPEMVSSSWHCVLDSFNGVRPTYVTSVFKP